MRLIISCGLQQFIVASTTSPFQVFANFVYPMVLVNATAKFYPLGASLEPALPPSVTFIFVGQGHQLVGFGKVGVYCWFVTGVVVFSFTQSQPRRGVPLVGVAWVGLVARLDPVWSFDG